MATCRYCRGLGKLTGYEIKLPFERNNKTPREYTCHICDGTGKEIYTYENLNSLQQKFLKRLVINNFGAWPPLPGGETPARNGMRAREQEAYVDRELDDLLIAIKRNEDRERQRGRRIDSTRVSEPEPNRSKKPKLQGRVLDIPEELL